MAKPPPSPVPAPIDQRPHCFHCLVYPRSDCCTPPVCALLLSTRTLFPFHFCVSERMHQSGSKHASSFVVTAGWAGQAAGKAGLQGGQTKRHGTRDTKAQQQAMGIAVKTRVRGRGSGRRQTAASWAWGAHRQQRRGCLPYSALHMMGMPSDRHVTRSSQSAATHRGYSWCSCFSTRAASCSGRSVG